MLNKKNIRKKLDELIEEKYQQRIVDLCCTPDYYKNKYLEYALKHHVSFPCIGRTYAELLVTGSKLYTHNSLDLKHAYAVLEYLNLYLDYSTQDLANQTINDLRDWSSIRFPYLIASSHGRFKDFVSIEDNFREKLLKTAILKELLAMNDFQLREELEAFLKKDSEEINITITEGEMILIKSTLMEIKRANDKSDMIHDIIGYRVIVDSVESSIEEQVLINFIYEFKDELIKFFDNLGYSIYDEKDYIANPKPNTGYQSYHCIINMMRTLIEIQIRTSQMHMVAENGSAAHDTIYKNKPSYNFLKKFLYEISEALSRRSINERIGILKPMHLSNRPWCFSPNEEIPATPAELKPFTDLEFLKSIHEKK